MKNIEYIILDLGGVIYDINYQTTIDNLSKLFGSNLESFFSKKSQLKTVDLFEEGQISGSEFCSYLKNTFNKPDISDIEIRKAWDSILIGFKNETVEYLKDLSKEKTLYLFSNTNEYHYSTLSKLAGEEYMDNFHAIFKEVYLSHTFGNRKPHPESFLKLLKEQNLEPQNGLFIDDSIQHVIGAKKAGLHALHLDLTKGETLQSILENSDYI